MTAPSMAIATVCYDRWDHLRVSLPSWRRLPGAPPVFVGTYDADTVPDWLEDVRLVSVPDEPFHRTRLRNCVADVARATVDPGYLLFIDADVRVDDPGVFARALSGPEEPPDYVLDSRWALAEDLLFLRPQDPERDDPGKRGTHLVRTGLFFEVGGYDQRMRGWGIEDRNLYGRYAALSDRVAFYDRDGLVHLEHGDDLRTRHNPGGAGRLAGMLTNLRRHLEDHDPLGSSWRDDFGYAGYRVTCPSAPMPEATPPAAST